MSSKVKFLDMNVFKKYTPVAFLGWLSWNGFTSISNLNCCCTGSAGCLLSHYCSGLLLPRKPPVYLYQSSLSATHYHHTTASGQELSCLYHSLMAACELCSSGLLMLQIIWSVSSWLTAYKHLDMKQGNPESWRSYSVRGACRMLVS